MKWFGWFRRKRKTLKQLKPDAVDDAHGLWKKYLHTGEW